ncbi:MAG: UbiA family prenyltransferase [Thermoplasmatales archaeon]|nr:UbiA family prenyltransferase [Thermoplasmatales archaeon]
MNPHLEIIRPLNCIMAGIGALAGCIIVGIPGINYLVLFKIGLAFAVVFLVTGAGNTLNDYYDADADKINHPSRPIPSGRLEQKNAMNFAITLFTAGIIISCFINTCSFLIAVIAALLLVAYEKKLKKKASLGMW